MFRDRKYNLVGTEANDPSGTRKAATHFFDLEPTNIVMQTFLLTFRRDRVISQEPVDLPIQTEKP